MGVENMETKLYEVKYGVKVKGVESDEIRILKSNIGEEERLRSFSKLLKKIEMIRLRKLPGTPKRFKLGLVIHSVKEIGRLN